MILIDIPKYLNHRSTDKKLKMKTANQLEHFLGK